MNPLNQTRIPTVWARFTAGLLALVVLYAALSWHNHQHGFPYFGLFVPALFLLGEAWVFAARGGFWWWVLRVFLGCWVAMLLFATIYLLVYHFAPAPWEFDHYAYEAKPGIGLTWAMLSTPILITLPALWLRNLGRPPVTRLEAILTSWASWVFLEISFMSVVALY